ncbi:MAG: tripartite tricarboxylate transporter substrate binding protein [Betaproteobacteria bacterium]|nr:tripartite tricarboxylate transporter substrate binding protein [Betaproteobacteria bacterium]
MRATGGHRLSTVFQHISRAGVLALVLVSMPCTATGAVAADAYPSKPIRFVLGYAPGGASDVVSRIVGTRLSEALGQPVVIDNRPAAAGSAAAGMVARTPADGYTLMLAATSTLAVNPSMYKSLPYDSLKDFTYLANFVSMPNLLVVNPNLPVKSVPELIALAKVEGGKLTFASAGVGSSNQFTAELFNYMAKIKMTHIPYKGGGPAMVDVAGGQVSLIFATIVSAIPLVKSGRLRPLGVTSAQRSPSMPEVPAIAEAGLPGYESTIWYGMVMPAGAPRAIVARLSSEVEKLLTMQDVKDRFQTLGADIMYLPPERFEQYVRAEIKKWSVVVRETGMRAE